LKSEGHLSPSSTLFVEFVPNPFQRPSFFSFPEGKSLPFLHGFLTPARNHPSHLNPDKMQRLFFYAFSANSCCGWRQALYQCPPFPTPLYVPFLGIVPIYDYLQTPLFPPLLDLHNERCPPHHLNCHPTFCPLDPSPCVF